MARGDGRRRTKCSEEETKLRCKRQQEKEGQQQRKGRSDTERGGDKKSQNKTPEKKR